MPLEVYEVTCTSYPSSLEDSQRYIENELATALTDASKDELAHVKHHVLRHVRSGRDFLRSACDALRSGDRESAWSWLVRASSESGSTRTALEGAWPRSVIDARKLASAGGAATKASFDSKQAAVAEAFLRLPGGWTSRLHATQALERLLEDQGLGASDGSRARLRKAHPQVDAIFEALPRKAKPARR